MAFLSNDMLLRSNERPGLMNACLVGLLCERNA